MQVLWLVVLDRHTTMLQSLICLAGMIILVWQVGKNYLGPKFEEAEKIRRGEL